MYSSKVADHIANPRNVGELDDPSGVGDVVNEVCQDRIRLSIRIEGGTLAAARVRASGCPPTLAAASVLTELIIGRQISEVQLLGRTDITSALGRLPAAKAHCAVLAIDALRNALESSGCEPPDPGATSR
ncbi:MAG TPA: iron-sulfur cluster assembly scaffold protein [Blastocatellia bacterium]|nr:iron-sulfur cluster assembly scaffold protein [Blastocatellia bacterium]